VSINLLMLLLKYASPLFLGALFGSWWKQDERDGRGRRTGLAILSITIDT